MKKILIRVLEVLVGLGIAFAIWFLIGKIYESDILIALCVILDIFFIIKEI